MANHQISALIVDKQTDGTQAPASIRQLKHAGELPAPAGSTLINVTYSSLNYKDGLAVTGKGKILRRLPIVPGIDLAGEVVEPGENDRVQSGDEVILTGWGMGEEFSGGYASMARVNGARLLSLPAGITARQAMAIGTAGFTAMLSLLALEDHGLTPAAANQNEVVVTGAAGGLGSMAIALLAEHGYRVVASTGRAEQEGDYLRYLGASEAIPREVLSEPTGKPLESERWAGAIDSVGGETLASVLRQTRAHGSVAACGLAGGSELPTTVLPFILRGVNLLGITAVKCERELCERVWGRLAKDLDMEKLDTMTQVISLNDVPQASTEILAGKVRGRIVVDLNL
ncbi:MAG: oxidoreductase [Candidatus Poribacteria bacterium]|nr:oxidoreductase [Candidatus Poribacteria bacterium]